MITQEEINALRESFAKNPPVEFYVSGERVFSMDDLLSTAEEAIRLRKELERVKFDLESTKKGGAVIGDLLNKERDENKRLRGLVKLMREALKACAPKCERCGEMATLRQPFTDGDLLCGKCAGVEIEDSDDIDDIIYFDKVKHPATAALAIANMEVVP